MNLMEILPGEDCRCGGGAVVVVVGAGWDWALAGWSGLRRAVCVGESKVWEWWWWWRLALASRGGWGVSGAVVTEPGQQDRIEAALVRLFPQRPR